MRFHAGSFHPEVTMTAIPPSLPYERHQPQGPSSHRLAALVTAHYRLGATVNVVLFVLAGVKIGVVLRFLCPGFSPLKFAYILIQIGALFAIPCVLRAMDHGSITPRQLYVTWWILAVLP